MGNDSLQIKDLQSLQNFLVGSGVSASESLLHIYDLPPLKCKSDILFLNGLTD